MKISNNKVTESHLTAHKPWRLNIFMKFILMPCVWFHQLVKMFNTRKGFGFSNQCRWQRKKVQEWPPLSSPDFSEGTGERGTPPKNIFVKNGRFLFSSFGVLGVFEVLGGPLFSRHPLVIKFCAVCNYNCDSWFDHPGESFSKEAQVKMFCLPITTQARFKCVPTFCGSIIIHIFTLLFFLIEYS